MENIIIIRIYEYIVIDIIETSNFLKSTFEVGIGVSINMSRLKSL